MTRNDCVGNLDMIFYSYTFFQCYIFPMRFFYPFLFFWLIVEANNCVVVNIKLRYGMCVAEFRLFYLKKIFWFNDNVIEFDLHGSTLRFHSPSSDSNSMDVEPHGH